MSRQSGWSSVSPAATAANAVPVGGGGGGGGAANTSSPPDTVLSVADKLRQAADLGNVLVPLDAASKHARKIYIGNLPPSATSEQVITQFFNQTLALLLPNKPPGDSIIGTYLNVQKRFAFIENRSIEETTFTLSLDGIQMDEYALKLRRPQDYNPQLAAQQLSQEMRLKGGISSLRGAWNPMQQQVDTSGPSASGGSGIISTSVEDGPHKVFIGGLPHHMAEHEVKELLSAYGPLKAFHLVKDRELDRSKGFAFCEWRDPTVTDVACQSLNGMKVGDRFLNVRRAVPHSTHRGGVGGAITTDSMPTLALPYLPPIDPKPLPPIQKGIPPLELPSIAPFLMAESAQSSRCLAVRNVVPSDSEVPVEVDRVQKLVEEVKTKANSIGRVRATMFHHSEGGRVLVEFSTPEEADEAQKILNGTELGGGIKADCALTEMISELRKGCLARIIAEAAMLSRLDISARGVYNETQKQLMEDKRQRRMKLLEESAPTSSGD